MAGTPLILSVAQLNTYVKSLLDDNALLSNVYVSGEISNFTDHYRSGHLYMSLKDAQATIKAVMFKYAAQRLRFQPESGMKVICRGRVSVYERDGQYQLYIDEMQPDGVGALHLAFEQTKKKLETKGLFAQENKMPLPRFPKRVAVITSPTGAARRDIEQIIARRYPVAEIVLYPVLVQGSEAAAQLTAAVEAVNRGQDADVIIIGRGGGSFEELFAFNDENLAHAIFRSEIPVVSAVGHETDFTICDFVADVRAATPSAAAELVTPDRLALSATIAHWKAKMTDSVRARVDRCEADLKSLRERPCMQSPVMMLEQRQMYVDAQSDLLYRNMERLLGTQENRFSQAVAGLQMLSPLQVLSRGYAITFKKDTVIRSVKEITSGDNIQIRYADGQCSAIVEDVHGTAKGEVNHEKDAL